MNYDPVLTAAAVCRARGDLFGYAEQIARILATFGGNIETLMQQANLKASVMTDTAARASTGTPRQLAEPSRQALDMLQQMEAVRSDLPAYFAALEDQGVFTPTLRRVLTAALTDGTPMQDIAAAAARAQAEAQPLTKSYRAGGRVQKYPRVRSTAVQSRVNAADLMRKLNAIG